MLAKPDVQDARTQRSEALPFDSPKEPEARPAGRPRPRPGPGALQRDLSVEGNWQEPSAHADADAGALRAQLRDAQRDRDAAWARAEALEQSLEIERLTSRAVATEAIEFREREARIAQLMGDATSEFASFHSEPLAKDLHPLFAQSSPSDSGHFYAPESSFRGSGKVPLQPCAWFATQGTPCDHERENAELLERLLDVTEKLQSAEEAEHC
jgi:hypothetical protein